MLLNVHKSIRYARAYGASKRRTLRIVVRNLLAPENVLTLQDMAIEGVALTIALAAIIFILAIMGA